MSLSLLACVCSVFLFFVDLPRCLFIEHPPRPYTAAIDLVEQIEFVWSMPKVLIGQALPVIRKWSLIEITFAFREINLVVSVHFS